MKILVIVAHPDDEILGVGATMLKHVEKGDHVEPGQLIAFVGDASSLRGFVLYFELINDSIPVSPLDSFGLKF